MKNTESVAAPGSVGTCEMDGDLDPGPEAGEEWGKMKRGASWKRADQETKKRG